MFVFTALCFICLCSSSCILLCFFFFFFNDTATTEIYTLSLHVALPISRQETRLPHEAAPARHDVLRRAAGDGSDAHCGIGRLEAEAGVGASDQVPLNAIELLDQF